MCLEEKIAVSRDVGPAEIRGFRGDYFFLSNFYDTSVSYKGLQYKNSEAAFQAQKCPERAAEFVNLTASKAKYLGRRVSLRADWDIVKDKIMYTILVCKFSQHPELKRKLTQTAPAHLYEENDWGDRYWGQVNGVGENKLGEALELIREVLSH